MNTIDEDMDVAIAAITMHGQDILMFLGAQFRKDHPRGVQHVLIRG
ncbi:hypothetical protein JHW40_12785 [Paracoccus alcaliphilus]|nr:hypothetical protein [Paracoccus alcaliphilus]WCR20047.1 hypothetical protein JHW40_12785 [Paracoccus alcaliphilus]